MRKAFVTVLIGLVGITIAATTNASTVTWGAQIGNGVGTANGTPLPNGSGDVILIGSFDISNATVTLNGGNEAFLMSHFTTFGSATIGLGSPNGAGSASDGYWSALTTNSVNALSLQNKEIFYWVFNSPTPAAATQYGIFTAPSNAAWTFPDDNSNPNTTITDLSQVPQNASGILWGSFGTGVSRDLASPLYNLAPVTAVPEPSSVALLVIGSAVGSARLLRRRK